MTPIYRDRLVTIYHGDCLDILPTLPADSVHAVVTDPPHGLGFMGKEWDSAKSFVQRKSAAHHSIDRSGDHHRPVDDAAAAPTRRIEGPHAYTAWCEQWAQACLRVLTPGGHLLAFGGTRTWHHLATAIENAGFEIRDTICWLYGSGFPKSLNVSRAIDKAEGAEPTVIAPPPYTRGRAGQSYSSTRRVSYDYPPGPITAPATPQARNWEGWGTGLKPAFTPIVVARKPLAGTVADTVVAYRTGALNIDACRVAANQDYRDKCASVVGLPSNRNGDVYSEWTGARHNSAHDAGRWPPNVMLDDEAAAELDQHSGLSVARKGKRRAGVHGDGSSTTHSGAEYTDSGGASRFFPTFRWEAKAPSSERPRVNGIAHPTVEPIALMRWLVRLVTPPAGTVVDPFLGSGTTAEAAQRDGFSCIGIERDDTYLPLITSRLCRDAPAHQPDHRSPHSDTPPQAAA